MSVKIFILISLLFSIKSNVYVCVSNPLQPTVMVFKFGRYLGNPIPDDVHLKDNFF